MSDKLKYRPGLTDRKSIDEENHIVSAMVSVKELDRFRDVVLPQAFRGSGIRNWRKNPVVFLFHASWGFPAGRGQKLEILDEGLRGHTKFATEIGGTIGDAINAAWDMIVNDYIRAWSIGFWAREWVFDGEEIAKLLAGMPDSVLVDVRRVLTRGELAEWSLVGIPASPSSLTERMAKSYQDPDELMRVAPPQIRDVLDFARKYDWRKDTHLEEWFVDGGCEPFCERKPQIVVEANECEIVDLSSPLLDDDDFNTEKVAAADGVIKTPVEEAPGLIRIDAKKLEALARDLKSGATILRTFIAPPVEAEMAEQEQELREDIELLQVLLGSDEASPGVPGRSSSE